MRLRGRLTALFLACASGAAAQATPPRKPATPQATTTKSAAKPSPGFETLLKAATDARQAERWDEAIGLYAKLVRLKPDYSAMSLGGRALA